MSADPPVNSTPPLFTIAAVERDTRLSKDILRAWEKRYGFPAPGRNANGERCYSAEQVEHLRLVSRLVEQGYRPGVLVKLPVSELAALPPRRPLRLAHDRGQPAPALDGLLDAVQQDPIRFGHAMRHELARRGLERFVRNVAAPLTSAVGQRWADGSFGVFDEHIFTEETSRILRQAIATLPRAGEPPRILMTTLSGETHGLGLLMAETLLTLDGATCISLGTETPLDDIARAAQAHAIDIVALSFSSAFAPRQAGTALRQLRLALPGRIALWAGGSGIAPVAQIPQVVFLAGLDEGREAVAAWRKVRHRAALD
jgi:methylmalonyl-CoA mutase cobalamin-binding subunit